MLARIANNVFWMGRYLERAEHLARYSREQYFTTLDAPYTINKKLALESILRMGGSYDEYREKYDNITSERVFNFTTRDPDNVMSIQEMIKIARENARSARYKLSDETWEAINKFYHYVNECASLKFRDEQRYDFYQSIINNTYITKGFITNTLMRDHVWTIINTGVHLEKAIQINRMLISRYTDLSRMDSEKLITPVENYLWATLLKTTDCLDIARRVYKSEINKNVVLHFLILNKQFPKSILHNLKSVIRSLHSLESKEMEVGSLEFEAEKLESRIKFLTMAEIRAASDEETLKYLIECLDKLNQLAVMFEKKYLSW
ncbi:alpha-E domain-containing protein [Flammeovirgaceae bacterium SG7u.111]|nr:alpha-E domain-containing protein [Flammeovirgaceae bacterium SG7u.132]WPO33977.1 alpha-E domain-containing protein [Flammeovirgaceae bacterium SG7u.111]